MIPEKIHGPAIELDQVAVNEGSQVLFDPISCRFEAGQWHAILGPNGSGKSSLLKTLLGLKNHRGMININWPDKQQARLGYMPQLVPFDVSLPISLRDYLLMSLSQRPVFMHRKLDDKVLQGLEQLRLHDKLERRLGDLSGGERQRLMLLCSLLPEPSLLIVDEPMSGLDAAGRDETIGLLTDYRNAGGTIIMVEHDWQLVEANCDFIYWLDGTIKTSGPCERFQEILEPVTRVSV